VPASGGTYRALLTIVHDDGSKQDVALDFSPGKHAFERRTKTVVAAEDYSEIRVRVEYGRAGGVVRFDSVSLVLDQD
jgi:hypothetical protein